MDETTEKEKQLTKEINRLQQLIKEVYEPLTELTNESLFLTDREGKYLFITKNMANNFGVPLEEVLGKNYGDFHAPEVTRIFLSRLEEVFTTGSLRQDEHVSRQGDKIILRTFVPVKNQKGEISKVAVIGQDITPLKVTETALKRNEERFKDIVENLSDFICLHDLAGSILRVNKAVLRLLKQEEEQVIGKNLKDFLEPQYRGEFDLYLEKVKKVGHDQGILTVVLPKSNRRILEYTSILRRWETPVVLCIAHDITERFRAEQKLKHTLSLLRATLESSTSGILVVDRVGKFVTANERFALLWNIPPELIKTKNTERILAIMGKQVEDVTSFFLMRKEIMDRPERDYRFEIYLRDGRIFEYTSKPQRDKGKICGLVFNFHDITSRRYMEEALRRSEERYRTVIENIEAGYYEMDLLGNYLFLNDAATRIFRLPAWEIIGSNFRKFTTEENGEKISDILSKVLTGHFPSLSCEWALMRERGERIFVESTVSLMRDAEGKPSGFRGIIRDITEKRKYEELLKFHAQTDPLTDCANRRRFEEFLAQEWRRNMRSGTPLALIMGDIDFFKDYNDHYGHQAGDDCLKKVASVMKDTLRRPSDLVSRYGGEEFALIMAQTDLQSALTIAEQIRSRIESLRIPHAHSRVSPVITISLGVASMIPEQGLSPLILLTKADKALYRAKKEGRNCVRPQD